MTTERDSILIEPTYQRFQLTELSFSQQFSHMYYRRLETLRESAVATGHALDPDAKLTRALDVETEEHTLCVGTIFKHIPTFKGFLKAYTEEQIRVLGGEADDEDGDALEVDLDDEKAKEEKAPSTLVIEDESGRLQLTGNIPVERFVTGMVVAIVGKLKGGRQFIVEKWSLCGSRPQTPMRPLSSNGVGPRYLAVVSGLNISSNSNSLARDVLCDFLCGNSNDPRLAQMSTQIGRLLVAGNMISANDNSRLKAKVKLDPTDHIKPSDTSNSASSAFAMREADRFLAQVGESIFVDVMPGDQDATNCFLPQQPIHPILLSTSVKLSSTKLVTNPYEMNVSGCEGGLQVFATSGQNVTDVIAQQNAAASDGSSRVKVLEDMVYGANPFPTAPNTLPCYPFRERDPFLFTMTPHIFIAGNQPQFESALLETVAVDGSPLKSRLIAAPVYESTRSIVLIDLASPNLDVEEIVFI